MNLKELKRNFIDVNPSYAEIPITDDSVTLGGEFQSINDDDEVWLLQCPKGTDLCSLEGQKLKLPGRSHIEEMEAVAVEFSKPHSETFGYCNRKGKYALRLLPLSGSVVLRNRLKANEMISSDAIAAMCPAQGRVPLPADIKVRHPLLGHQFENKLNLNSSIADRLRQADEASTKMMKKIHSQSRNRPKTLPAPNELQEISIKSEPSESENGHETAKTKKIKREKLGNNDVSEMEDSIKKSKKRKNKQLDDEVSEDLSWLKNL